MLPIGAKSDGEHFRPEDTSIADAAKVPALAVFDLDACLWDQEMYTLGELVDANKPVMGQLGRAGEGVAGARSGQDVIRLHPGALYALQQIHDGAYPGMRAAVASSADTPLAELIGYASSSVLLIADWSLNTALTVPIEARSPVPSKPFACTKPHGHWQGSSQVTTKLLARCVFCVSHDILMPCA